MANVVVFLVTVFAVAFVVGAAAFGLAVLARATTTLSPRSDEVLPSHYSSLVNTNPSKYPGYCPECGTNNDPEFSVCRNCSSRLPETRSERTDRSTRSLFEGEQ